MSKRKYYSPYGWRASTFTQSTFCLKILHFEAKYLKKHISVQFHWPSFFLYSIHFCIWSSNILPCSYFLHGNHILSVAHTFFDRFLNSHTSIKGKHFIEQNTSKNDNCCILIPAMARKILMKRRTVYIRWHVRNSITPFRCDTYIQRTEKYSMKKRRKINVYDRAWDTETVDVSLRSVVCICLLK